jgi:hypothetical protein
MFKPVFNAIPRTQADRVMETDKIALEKKWD